MAKNNFSFEKRRKELAKKAKKEEKKNRKAEAGDQGDSATGTEDEPGAAPAEDGGAETPSQEA